MNFAIRELDDHLDVGIRRRVEGFDDGGAVGKRCEVVRLGGDKLAELNVSEFEGVGEGGIRCGKREFRRGWKERGIRECCTRMRSF